MSAPFELGTPLDELLGVLSDLAGYLQRIADTLDPPKVSSPNGKVLLGARTTDEDASLASGVER